MSTNRTGFDVQGGNGGGVVLAAHRGGFNWHRFTGGRETKAERQRGESPKVYQRGRAHLGNPKAKDDREKRGWSESLEPSLQSAPQA